MSILDGVQWIVSFALAVIPWFFPELTWYIKVIIALGIIVVSIAVYCLRLVLKSRSEQRSYTDLEKRHRALAIQFDEKIEREKRYEQGIEALSLLLHIACADTEKAKIHDIYKAFLMIQEHINNGGRHHE